MEPQPVTPQAHIDAQALAKVRALLPDGTPEALSIDLALAQANAPAPTELKLLPDGTTSFEAAGCKYYIAGGFSIERYTLYEEFGLTFGLSTPFNYVFATLVDIMNKLNAHPVKLFDLSILVNKALTNVAKLETKESYAFQVCTLFINREGEDVTTWTPELAKAKLADWNAAGLDARFFLRLAAVLVAGFTDAYALLTQNTLLSQAAQTKAQPQQAAS
jgi:hypothetical protein